MLCYDLCTHDSPLSLSSTTLIWASHRRVFLFPNSRKLSNFQSRTAKAVLTAPGSPTSPTFLTYALELREGSNQHGFPSWCHCDFKIQSTLIRRRNSLRLSVARGQSLEGFLSLSARNIKDLDLSVILWDGNSIFLGGTCEELGPWRDIIC